MQYNILQFFGKKLTKILLLLIGFSLLGTVGFMWFEGFNFLDALWLTTITLSTVGFETLKPLSDTGKIFSIFLILSGIGTVAYALSIIAQEVVDGKFMERYKSKKMDNLISRMQGHVIICGFGRCGKQAARRIRSQNIPFVILDNKFKDFQVPEEFANAPFIEGNATEDAVLAKANIAQAKALITTLPSDAENLFVVLTARQNKPTMQIISRASSTSSIDKLKMAGANNVIMPEQIGGEQMASLVGEPELYEFIDDMFLDNYDGANLIIIEVEKKIPSHVGKPIKELTGIMDIGCKIIGIKEESGHFTINPMDDTILNPKNKLVILGNPGQIRAIKQLYSGY